MSGTSRAVRANRKDTTAKRSLKLVGRVVGALVGALIFLYIIELELHFNIFEADFWGLYARGLVDGLWQTVLFTFLIIPVGLVIGFVTGWARVTRIKFLTYPATLYVDLVRGIPPIVLILFAFFFGPSIAPGIFDPTQAGRAFAALALALHTGAYQAEIFRAGFQSVPRGQVDAGVAVGLSKAQSMSNVILPQTFRLVLPALGNELATVLKDTSLLSIVLVKELTYFARGQAQTATIFLGRIDYVYGLWTAVAIMYLVLTFSMTLTLQFIERRFQVPGLGSVSV